MTIIEIECPNCGEKIKINIAKEALTCSVCDERFDVKEAMAKYIIKLQAIISGTHNSKTDSVHIIDNTDFKKDVIPDTSTAPINAFAKTETTETEGNALIPVDEVKMEGNALIPVDEAEQPLPRGIPVGDSVFSPIEDFEIEDGVLKKYIGKDAKVIIPNCVTRIGYDAFKNCKNLTNITIPNSVKSIGNRAFSRCENLTSITIPNSVTSIGNGAFDDCRKLTSITIPNSVTCIGIKAFNKTAYYNNSSNWKNGLLYIGKHLIKAQKDVTNITIQSGTLVIAERAFYKSNSLKSVSIPNSVTNIGKEAFWGCKNLTSITIPDSVTSIGERAFSWCDNLQRITVDENNLVYDSRDNCNAIIESKTNVLISGCNTTAIPNGVTKISQEAFSHCINLTSITIPNSVTSIGRGAFSWCDNLQRITVDKNNPVYDSRDNCNAIIESKTNTLICGCYTTVIPCSITSIGEFAFRYCKNLTSISIPSSVTSIGAKSFSGCENLKTITLPKKIVSFKFAEKEKFKALCGIPYECKIKRY